jgi:hypothetical protein
MILQAADGTIYKVHFRHFLPVHKNGKVYGLATWPEKTIPKLVFPENTIYRQLISKRPMTECLFHKGHCTLGANGQCLSSVFITEARCSPRDTFDKKMGRRIALGRALHSLVADERVRLQLMADYQRQIAGVKPQTAARQGVCDHPLKHRYIDSAVHTCLLCRTIFK